MSEERPPLYKEDSDDDSASSDLEGLEERLALLDIAQRPRPQLKPEDLEPGVSVNSVVGRWLKEFPIDWDNKEHRILVQGWRLRIQEAQSRARWQEVRQKEKAWKLSVAIWYGKDKGRDPPEVPGELQELVEQGLEKLRLKYEQLAIVKVSAEDQAIERKSREDYMAWTLRRLNAKIVHGMHLPWGFVLVHYSMDWTAQFAAGGWSENGYWSFMKQFEPIDPSADAFKKARWLVANIPQIYARKEAFPQATSGDYCLRTLNKMQQTVEPTLGYDYFWGNEGHNLLLHRGSSETAYLLKKLHTPNATWYKLKQGGKGLGAHAAKLTILDMLRKRILMGPGRVGNMQLILPEEEWRRNMASSPWPDAPQKLLFNCEFPEHLRHNRWSRFPIQACLPDPAALEDLRA